MILAIQLIRLIVYPLTRSLVCTLHFTSMLMFLPNLKLEILCDERVGIIELKKLFYEECILFDVNFCGYFQFVMDIVIT